MITFTVISESPNKLNPEGTLRVVYEREKQTIGERLDLAIILMLELRLEIRRLSKLLGISEEDIIAYLHYEGIEKLKESEYMASCDEDTMEMMRK